MLEWAKKRVLQACGIIQCIYSSLTNKTQIKQKISGYERVR